MQQQEQLERQREHEQMLQQQQQKQQNPSQHLLDGNVGGHPPPPPQPLDDIWLSNISELPSSANAQSASSNSSVYPDPIYLTNPSVFNMPPQNYNPPYQQSIQHQQPPPPPPPGFDINGQPVRIRKKPGRKPNPASPALRKAQNRAAQRAFRERKERHLKDLETTIRNLREQRNTATRELNEMKAYLESYKAETWYLKGVVLTLQFICMHHNIQIPTHSPYLSEEALAKMAQTAPHAIEAYVNSYTRNNTNLKSTMSYHFVDKQMHNNHSDTPPMDHSSSPMSSSQFESNQTQEEEPEDHHAESEDDEHMDFMHENSEEPTSVKHEYAHPSHVSNQQDQHTAEDQQQAKQTALSNPPISSVEAIQHIRLKLGVQSTITNNSAINDQATARLKPTILQLAIPHDSRIDLVPTPHMRDRMIIFRDQMDYDRCFAMLLNEAVYHGGDPTMSESWELPADFFSEFWYLTIDYDIKKTNKWRREKGLEDVAPGPQLHQQHQIMSLLENGQSANWNSEVLNQIVKEMPALQPMDDNTGYPLSPPKQYQNENDSTDQQQKMYKKLMGGPPESRRQVASPTLENIIDLMNSSL
ncbi:uncharacterized protein ATC70_000238 [Mucor velutinosus]|uniref:BZIP domain-containing protein n=1 Tax=Mucor velutinosus TaxID=708070 RepID=A0AAN7DKX0_9FUNG|nr:hypothetical protein ATC70_000238 [Mucor velutinosus]